MNSLEYVGHPSQLGGIEEHRLVGGKGDGMRLLQVNNGKGLMFTISADRCGDISRLFYKGINLGFLAPCGYVAPSFYDNKETGFLKSFTAGFFTTCGLRAVGSPCTDEDENLPLHGTISNTPAENIIFSEEEQYIRLIVRDASLFSSKIVLTREYRYTDNEIIIHDVVSNIGFKCSPYMILYHFNMGYPLLSERAIVNIPNSGVKPRNKRSEEGIKKALIMEMPQEDFEEQCYYYDTKGGNVSIYNPDIKIGLSMEYNKEELPFFTQWKLMEKGQYVLGLEPGNCTPDGRDVMRKSGKLKFLQPGEKAEQTIKIKIWEE